jgi:aspartyl protease family protein
VSFKKYIPQIMVIAIVVVSICLWGWIFNHFSIIGNRDALNAANIEMPQETDLEQLEAFDVLNEQVSDCQKDRPKSSSKYLLAGDGLGVSQHTKLFIGNEHGFPVWIRIFEHDSSEEYGAIFLGAHKNSYFHLPENGYKVIVESGTNWCNLQVGFVDAALIHSDKTIHVMENETASLRLLSFGPQPADVMLSLSHSGNLAARAERIHGTGTLTLQRVMGGHYAVEGSINGVAANFLVDTGATKVAIPESFAKHAGITACKKTKMKTANGLSDACFANAREMTLGQFTLRNVAVSYGKGIPDDTFLLGMNVISQFRMEQKGEVMTLSRQ